MAQPGPMPGGVPPLQPGQQPTPQQIQAMQQQFFAEAARRGLTPQQFGEQLKAQALAQQQAAQQQGGQPGQPGQQGPPPQGGQPGAGPGGAQVQMRPQAGQQIPIQPGPPKPEALALANFLKGQDLKSRQCVFQQQRKELFKVKRAIRAIQSPAYEKARKKNPLLPAVSDRASAENAFKTLPISMLALRVSKLDPADNPAHGQPGHQHGGGGGKSKSKGKKGVWTVKIEPQQDARDEYHYIWIYEGSQWKQKLYAVGALLVVIAAVMFPLWPVKLRIGVWYLSMGALGLLAAFFGLAIVRLIIFLITIVTTPPGIWIYPNLFEDVGFFDSFKPGWAWRETKESLLAKKTAKKEKKLAKKNKLAGKVTDTTKATTKSNSTRAPESAQSIPVDVPIVSKTGSTGAAANEGVAAGTSSVTGRKALQARVEEIGDEDE